VEAERRQVTVLFTGMVGFTSFSERLGEEAAYTLMRSPSKLMDEAVREHGGVVQGFTGDGIMAVFGAPSRSRTRRCGPAERPCPSCNGLRSPDLTSKRSMACDHNCA
jgi:class 3 adenylate cyclase